MTKPVLPPYTPEELAAEEWREIPGYPWYQASTLGRVRSIDREIEIIGERGTYKRFQRGTMLKISAGQITNTVWGIKTLTLSTEHGQLADNPGRVVWTAFRGPVPRGSFVVSYDHNVLNLRLWNLRLFTKKELHDWIRYERRPGTYNLLDADMVRQARAAHAQNVPIKHIAQSMNVRYNTLWLALRNRTWKHVT